MHPEKATTQARFARWQNRDLRVYDEASGTPLLVEARALPDGLVDYIVTFSKPQGDGYKFRVEYLVTGLVKRLDSVILSFFPIIPVRIPSFYFVSSWKSHLVDFDSQEFVQGVFWRFWESQNTFELDQESRKP